MSVVPYCFQFPFPVHKPPAYDLVACIQTSRKTSSLQARGCLATRSSCSLVSQVNSRRSADYHPTIWEHDLIETICSPYSDTVFSSRVEELKLQTKKLLKELTKPLSKLKFIDSLHRLGVAYHFKEEIRVALNQIHINGFRSLTSLYGTALGFRLLRQHGYNVSSDVFNSFRDDQGFMNGLRHDAKGLLSLNEAAHLGIYGEKTLEEAKEFSVRHLKCLREEVDLTLVEQIKHSLEIPLHWKMPRLEARRYIDVYERVKGRSSVLLELAKLDFNVVQSVHQEEVKELSRWWKELSLADKLKFSRDRLFENYLWAAGIAYEPRFSKCRKVLTKLICILTVIDDIYDVYGSLEELVLFTSAIKSWDDRAIGALPDYLKVCFNALCNFVKETANDIYKDCGWDVMHIIKREWENLCEAYLKEAKWFNKGYKPTLSEYLENAWVSVGGPIVMVHAYFSIEQNPSKMLPSWFEQGHGIIYWSSLITRLSDDLGTSEAEMQRGDIPKSTQCHMNDTGESDATSKEYIKDLIASSWLNLNKEFLTNSHPTEFVNVILNMARTAQCIFHHGDEIGNSTGTMKNRLTSLFIEPIRIE